MSIISHRKPGRHALVPVAPANRTAAGADDTREFPAIPGAGVPQEDSPALGRPYVAEREPVDPLTAPARLIPVTVGAHIARSIPGADNQFTLNCGCGRTYGCHGHASFAALHDAARDFGWDTDAFGAWACPACQAKPGYRAPYAVRLWTAKGAPEREHALARSVAGAAAPVNEPLRDWLDEAYGRGRPWLSVAALKAAAGMHRRAGRRSATGKAAAA